MQTHIQEPRGYGVVMALLTGTVVGAGLAMWFAPRLRAELGERVAGSAKRLGERAAERYQDASARAGQAAGALARKGRDVRDEAAGAVARGAHEVERFAVAVKSDRTGDAKSGGA